MERPHTHTKQSYIDCFIFISIPIYVTLMACKKAGDAMFKQKKYYTNWYLVKINEKKEKTKIVRSAKKIKHHRNA